MTFFLYQPPECWIIVCSIQLYLTIFFLQIELKLVNILPQSPQGWNDMYAALHLVLALELTLYHGV